MTSFSLVLAHIPEGSIGVDQAKSSKRGIHHLTAFDLKKVLGLAVTTWSRTCFRMLLVGLTLKLNCCIYKTEPPRHVCFGSLICLDTLK